MSIKISKRSKRMNTLSTNIKNLIFNNKGIIIIYCIITSIFISMISLDRSYQDLWILQDVFIPTLLYIIVFSVVAVLITDNRALSLVCSLFVIVLNAIPNLKYALFYGTYDAAAHYGTINALLSSGFIPQTGFYASEYSNFPGMHIFLSEISIVFGVDINFTIKLITSVIFGIIPLMVYFTSKGIFSPRVQKGLLTASALPFVASYNLSGSIFALVLFFCFFCVLFKLSLAEYNTKYIYILVIFGFSLLFSHFVTITSLLLFLSIALLLGFLYIFTEKQVLTRYGNLIKIYLILLVSWVIMLIYEAHILRDSILNVILRNFFGEVTRNVVPERLFVLSMFDQFKIIITFHIKDVIIVMLCLLGLLVLIKNIRIKNHVLFNRFYLPLFGVLCSILLVLGFQYATNFGSIEYGRYIRYAIVFSPFLVGLFLWCLDKKLIHIFHKKNSRVFLNSIVVFLIITISLIQVFPYQPMIPRAAVLSEDLPKDEYVTNRNRVNTIYQEKMVSFGGKYYDGYARIASDRVTRWQIRGFANESFYNNHIYYSPLDTNEVLRWNIFLLHYGNKSGSMGEKVEYRTVEKIESFKVISNIVYDNRESFILHKR